VQSRWGRFKSSICNALDSAEVTALFRLRGSVIPKASLWAIPSAALSVFFQWVFFKLEFDDVAESVMRVSQIWSSFTFILGVLIVFRTNQAYARFWEGATLLQQVRGEWYNASSSLLAFTSSKPEKQEQVKAFEREFICLMSMLYCAGLQTVALIADDKLEIIDNQGVDPKALAFLRTGVDRCEVVLQWVQRLIVNAMDSDVVPIAPPVLSRVFQELSRGIVNIHNVRKIAEIPFPFPYTQMLTLMLVLQTFLTPALTAAITRSPVWASTLTFLVVEVFWCMNYIASEIEQPFGEDLNDLPIVDMLRDMNRSLLTLLRAEVKVPPVYTCTRSSERKASKTISCMDANYTSTNPSLVEGFAKSRSRTLNVGLQGSSSSLRSHNSSTSSASLRRPFTSGASASSLFDAERGRNRYDGGLLETPSQGHLEEEVTWSGRDQETVEEEEPQQQQQQHEWDGSDGEVVISAEALGHVVEFVLHGGASSEQRVAEADEEREVAGQCDVATTAVVAGGLQPQLQSHLYLDVDGGDAEFFHVPGDERVRAYHTHAA